MTGITDIVRSSQTATTYLTRWLRLTRQPALTMGACPQPTFPDPRPTLALQQAAPPVEPTPAPTPAAGLPERSSDPESRGLAWALLLPVTSRGCKSPDAFWEQFSETAAQLRATTDRARTHVHLAVDMQDPLLDTPDSLARMTALLSGLSVTPHRLPPAFAGSMCWIWSELAERAVAGGADLFLLVGDDVVFEAPGWQVAVEQGFRSVAERCGLPLGCACVAVRDLTFEGFPTFPVLHRTHLDIFGKLFPPEFKNQHGDPFLWEIYRRWGAAQFAALPAQLRNCVGGASAARYAKNTSLVWRDRVLSDAIDTLERWLHAHAPAAQRMPCLDVVVPTFRCDVQALSALASLPCAERHPVSLHTLIVVDDPDSKDLPAILQLVSYEPNRTVRVYVMEANAGASTARNLGLSQCFGDHAVLLDDDVQPQSGLVPAYLGAIARHPAAAGYVGMTQLPPARTLLQHALQACGVCHFYGIAARLKRPPWGVTANLCVRARTNNTVWFSDAFPKTGGGEDVDFCFRLCAATHEDLVSVPQAVAVHPFWKHPLRQVLGWASGDVLCLDSLPSGAFWTAPNWAVLALLFLALGRITWALLTVLLECAFLAATYMYALQRQGPHGCAASAGACALSVLPPMLQDARRVASKVRRLRCAQLAQQFDWMGGQQDHVAATQVVLAIKLFATLAAVLASELPSMRVPAVSFLVLLLVLWARAQGNFLPPLVGTCSNPLALHSSAQPFIVLATARTGSNMLCGLLHGVRSVHMHNELFNQKGVFSHGGGVDKDTYARNSAPGAFLIDALSRSDCKAVGFKLFPEHMRRSRHHAALFTRILADSRITKVILRRENQLAVAKSSLRAATSGNYTHLQLDDIRVSMSPAELQKTIDDTDECYNFLRKATAGQDVLELTYEGVCATPLEELRRVCLHIGALPPDELPQNIFQPQTCSSRPEDGVANWDELQRAFEYSERACDFA